MSTCCHATRLTPDLTLWQRHGDVRRKISNEQVSKWGGEWKKRERPDRVEKGLGEQSGDEIKLKGSREIGEDVKSKPGVGLWVKAKERKGKKASNDTRKKWRWEERRSRLLGCWVCKHVISSSYPAVSAWGETQIRLNLFWLYLNKHFALFQSYFHVLVLQGQGHFWHK